MPSNQMVRVTDQGYRKIEIVYICGCFVSVKNLEGLVEPLDIPKFYSKKEAEKAGWTFTVHPYFCPKDKKGVWICPKCSKKLKRLK